jgi:nicotinate-nucleotide pyrophosphorylase (carboxylating)
MTYRLHKLQISSLIDRALEEDWGSGDWTTDLCVPAGHKTSARIIAKEACLVAGADVAEEVMHRVDPSLKVEIHVNNGEIAEDQQTLMGIQGEARSILKAERVALNFMGRMTGIATLTEKYCSKLEGTQAQLLDTRKTTPGLRLLEKHATLIGGARNHRFGLSDGVIVKENHIRAAGGIKIAVAALLESLPPTLKVEVEVTNRSELEQAIESGADLIMLDNMSVEQMRDAVSYTDGRALLEASGNVRLNNIQPIAATGVNFISTSEIIQGAKWADLSLLFDI